MSKLREVELVVRVKRPVTEPALAQLIEGVAMEMMAQLRKMNFSKEEYQESLVVKFHVTFDRTD